MPSMSSFHELKYNEIIFNPPSLGHMVLEWRGRVDLKVNAASSNFGPGIRVWFYKAFKEIHVRNMPLATWVTCKNEARSTSVWSLPQVLLQTGFITPTHGEIQCLKLHPGTSRLEHFQGQLLTGLIVYSKQRLFWLLKRPNLSALADDTIRN